MTSAESGDADDPEAVRQSAGKKDERAGFAPEALIAAHELDSAFEHIERLILIAVHMQVGAVAKRDDPFRRAPTAPPVPAASALDDIHAGPATSPLATKIG